MSDPIAEYDAYESAGAEKRALAIKALKKLLKFTQKKLLRLEQKKVVRPTKPTGKKRTPEHIAAMAAGRRKAARSRVKERA